MNQEESTAYHHPEFSYNKEEKTLERNGIKINLKDSEAKFLDKLI